MPDIQPITYENLGNLGVDKVGHLYWHGEQIVTVLSLPDYVNYSIALGGFAAFVAAAWPIYRYYRLDRRDRRHHHES